MNNENLVHINSKNFEDEVLKSKEPIIIDFWAEWCRPCKMMGPLFEELSTEYKGRLKFGKINTEEEAYLAQQFQIQGIPSLSVVKGNTEIGRIVGYSEKDILRKKIDEILKKIN
jgi:thioredoxin 1